MQETGECDPDIGPWGPKDPGPYCRVWDSLEYVNKVCAPDGAKLLSLELFYMGISLKFDTELCQTWYLWSMVSNQTYLAFGKCELVKVGWLLCR